MVLLNMFIFQGKTSSFLVVLQPKITIFLANFQGKNKITPAVYNWLVLSILLTVSDVGGYSSIECVE